MKAFIRQKRIYYIILTLHMLFLSMPVSRAGDIVLCYNEKGEIKIDLRLPEECHCCVTSGNFLQEKDLCYCVDVPISKQVEENPILLKCGDIQPQPQICLKSVPFNLLNSLHDGLFTPAHYPYLKNQIQELLHTTVLLI